METKIDEVAQTSSTEILQEATSIAMTTLDTPLHVACRAGNLQFVVEFLKNGQEFVRDLNRDGLSPLHVAAIAGHVGIVKELLKVDVGLCLVKGREKRIPLHCAAFKGRVDVVRELIVVNGDSVGLVTSRGETVLHLAVMDGSFDVLHIVLEDVKMYRMVEMVNWRDERGDTVLHLAAAKKQHEVIDLLLRSSEVIRQTIKVNLKNEMGYTPLDMLRITRSDSGDIEMHDIFVEAGGLRAFEMTKHLQPELLENANQTCAEKSYSSQFRYNSIRDQPDKVRDVLLFIATLITTSTFQAGLSPPKIKTNSPSEMSDKGIKSLKIFEGFLDYAVVAFLVSNTVGFLFSLYMINSLVKGFPLRRELRASMLALAISYGVSLITRLPETPFYVMFLIALGVPLPMLAVVKVYKLVKVRRGRGMNQVQI